MRLVFPNGEHSDLLVAPGDTFIGCASDNAVVLNIDGVSNRHAQLSVDARGYTLTVFAPAQVHINARPVREKALLRLGDVVSIDTVQMVLKPDQDGSIRTGIPEPQPLAWWSERETADANSSATPTSKLVLRGVSGSYFGRIVSVRGRLVMGRGSDCDLILDEPEMSRQHAAIEIVGDNIYLRDLGSANGTLVNGVQVRNAVLHSGDQLAFDRNRFVLEAPGLPLRSEDYSNVSETYAPNITQTMRAVPVQPIDDNLDETKGEVWWLIATAALIGGGIALLLLVRF